MCIDDCQPVSCDIKTAPSVMHRWSTVSEVILEARDKEGEKKPTGKLIAEINRSSQAMFQDGRVREVHFM